MAASQLVSAKRICNSLSSLSRQVLPVLVFGQTAFAQNDIILPPPTAPQVIPRHNTLEDAENDLKLKRKLRGIREPKAKSKKPVKTKKNLNDEKKIWKYYAGLSLLIPYVKTHGNFRKDYKMDPGMAVNLKYRLGEGNPFDKKSIWVGFRMAPFSGSGSYQDQNGRMSFLYWGPSLSYGKINFAKSFKSNSADKKQKKKNTGNNSKLSIQDGWSLSLGFSLLSRYGTVSESFEQGEGDLSNNALAFDAPGLWTEASYATIFGKTISCDLTLGTQVGESKVFIYGAIGVGLWY